MERRQILEKLVRGEISLEQAEHLLDEARPPTPQAPRPPRRNPIKTACTIGCAVILVLLILWLGALLMRVSH